MKSFLGRALLLGAWAPAAFAIVNTESFRIDQPPEGSSGSVYLEVDGSSGNSDKFGLGLGTRAQWKKDNVTDLVILSYDYGENRDVRNTNEFFAHARHVNFWRDDTAWEAYAQSEADEFARLEYRHLAGGGLRNVLVRRIEYVMYFSTGAFYSRERIEQNRLYPDEPLKDSRWRANIYLVVSYPLSESVLVGSTTYWQPALNDVGDYRLLEQAGLIFKINERLDLTVKVNIAHDSKPPAGVDKMDIDYKTGIELSF